MRIILHILLVIIAISAVIVGGSSIYMLNYSLKPDANRDDTDSCYHQLYADYPETKQWVDSLESINALRDTFIVMPDGYRCHAYYVSTGSRNTAVVVHGWRDQAIKYFCLAQMYEQELGYNVVIPDLYASGKSDGNAIRMGWLDRHDIKHWLETFKTDTMVVHGVSMGAAAAMMLSAEDKPKEVSDLRFVADCGYTSVWDEFSLELKKQFSLPEFPLMYTTSLLCKLIYGWSFGEASALNQVRKSPYPILFIHGDSDTFVPTEMSEKLYKVKQMPKSIWITKDTEHAKSFRNHRDDYIKHIKAFVAHKNI